MIKLKLSFGDNQPEKEFKIEDGELLKTAVGRATTGVPLGKYKLEEVFNAVVNGHIIEPDFWGTICLKESDNILLTPKIKDGDFGQVVKQVLIIAVAVVASVVFPPLSFGAVGSGLLVAGVTLAATLALNALIPPPVSDVGLEGGLGGSIDDSQMYSITGQSNQMRRLGVVPKVYGTHRMFPTLAAVPYTELAVNPANGEVIQYLCGIYDFGLGTVAVSDIKIGETPIDLNSLEDFSYRFVDPARPEVIQDQWDRLVSREFLLYKGDRTTNSLSFDLADGEEVIEVTANNPEDLQQEIILDFVCPRGLFGYSSGGELKNRNIVLNIDFAPAGSSDWKPYNDDTAVDNFGIIGGNDLSTFSFQFPGISPAHPLFNTYYNSNQFKIQIADSGILWRAHVYPKTTSNVLLLEADKPWQIGSAFFLNDQFIGNITTITPSPGGYAQFVEVALDRNITESIAYQSGGFASTNAPNVITWDVPSLSACEAKSTTSILSRAVVYGSRSSAVFSSFRFKPKAIGQFKVRVRRTNTEGDFSGQKADDITWGGLTTAYNRPPVVTNKRHTFLEIKVRATNQLNGNIDNLSGVASQVVDIYDPLTETWSRGISNNPAWVFADLLTGEVNKKKVDKSRLHMPSLVAWAEYCDEVPTSPPDYTYLAPRFQCNFILDYEATLQGVLYQVCGAAQASLNIIDGKYGVLVDRLKTTPVQVFTARNSRDFSSNRFYGPRPHALKVKFIDPNLGWELTEVIVYDNGYDELTAIDFEEITSFACTTHEQAWRFGRYMIAQNKLRQETMSLLVDFEALICTRGDYVQIAQDVMQVGGRPARIKSVSGSEVTIDDALDIDSDINYGYTHRAADGTIKTSTLAPVSSRVFSIDGGKVIFENQDTTGQTFEAYYRHGGVPPVIGQSKKVKALAGVFSSGNTAYTLPEAPLNNQEINCWLNGIFRTDYSLAGSVVTFTGQDTTGQVFDAQYRYAGADVTGSLRKLTSLVGVYSAGDTVYTLSEAAISDHDVTAWLNGIMRTDYTVAGNLITFAGQDTTSQSFDVQYRYTGGTSKIGSARKANSLTGVYADGDTTYTLPEPPLGENELIVQLNGIMYSDYSRGVDIPAVGDLIVIGEVGRIVFDCIVKSISMNDDLSAQISLVERANGIFDYESESTIPEYDPQVSRTSRPDFYPPKAVTALTLSANTWECAETQSGYNYYAEISWDIPPGSVYEFFEIWMDDGRGYRSVANTNAKYFRVSISQDRLGSPHGLKVVAVAASGKKLQLVQMPEVTFTPVVKAELPSDVQNFGMSITNQALQLAWSSIPDCDANKYEIRYSPDVNDVWEASVPLQIVDRNVNSITVQARTGVYMIKAVDFAGNKSLSASRSITTIPNLFDLNVIETFNDAPTFPGQFEQTEKMGSAVVLTEKTAGTADTMEFFETGYYTVFDLLDLGDIYSVRLASYIRADGYRYGELLSDWDSLDEIDNLSTSSGEDWDVLTEYRATDEILAMADWAQLLDIEHINEGIGAGFTDWRPIPSIGDATGRVFQFRIRLDSLTPNVSPRLFDGTIKADMPDRVDSFENLISSDSLPHSVTYERRFHGPDPSPNVQISIDNGEAGDYWEFENKTLEGFQIRFYDSLGNQVSRQFDVLAKGYGSRHSVTI